MYKEIVTQSVSQLVVKKKERRERETRKTQLIEQAQALKMKTKKIFKCKFKKKSITILVITFGHIHIADVAG